MADKNYKKINETQKLKRKKTRCFGSKFSTLQNFDAMEKLRGQICNQHIGINVEA
jgi:hypothetical protein